MITIIKILLYLIATLTLLLSWYVLFPLHQPTTMMFWALKVMTCGLSPALFLTGVIMAFLGAALHASPLKWMCILGASIYLLYIVMATRPPQSATGFERVFGSQWENKIPAERQAFMLGQRYVIRFPKSPDPILSQNIPFYTIPETNRQVLCDLWQPPPTIKPSGVAFIYLHGSAWAVLDKDFGTRPFFRHLASQGHVIMDVAYRLFPETGFMGMVEDTKHAIAWMKAHAAVYGVDPQRIVIGGGSAGAHIALLSAYTADNKLFLPDDLDSADVSVRGVISLYGQSNLSETYYHTAQDRAKHSALAQTDKGESGGMPSWMQKNMGADFHRLGFDKKVEPGMLAPMLGGTPEQKPEAYALFSPISYVSKICPPTLFIHGEHDILAPLKAIRELYARLDEAGVPIVLHAIPNTDHAFDLIFPKISPCAHNAIYDVERFLALMEQYPISKELHAQQMFTDSIIKTLK